MRDFFKILFAFVLLSFVHSKTEANSICRLLTAASAMYLDSFVGIFGEDMRADVDEVFKLLEKVPKTESSDAHEMALIYIEQIRIANSRVYKQQDVDSARAWLARNSFNAVQKRIAANDLSSLPPIFSREGYKVWRKLDRIAEKIELREKIKEAEAKLKVAAEKYESEMPRSYRKAKSIIERSRHGYSLNLAQEYILCGGILSLACSFFVSDKAQPYFFLATGGIAALFISIWGYHDYYRKRYSQAYQAMTIREHRGVLFDWEDPLSPEVIQRTHKNFLDSLNRAKVPDSWHQWAVDTYSHFHNVDYLLHSYRLRLGALEAADADEPKK